MSDTSALENLKYAHAIDVSLDLSSQEVHELWAEIEAKEIISSCMQILSSQDVHELWGEIETRDKRVAELEAERLELRKILGWAYDLDEYKDNPEGA